MTQVSYTDIDQDDFLAQQLSQRFDLSKAPLLRIGLYKTSDEQQYIYNSFEQRKLSEIGEKDIEGMSKQ